MSNEADRNACRELREKLFQVWRAILREEIFQVCRAIDRGDREVHRLMMEAQDLPLEQYFGFDLLWNRAEDELREVAVLERRLDRLNARFDSEELFTPKVRVNSPCRW